MKIEDETGTNLVNLRRTIYLTIMNSLQFEEAGHKLLQIGIPDGRTTLYFCYIKFFIHLFIYLIYG